MIIDLTSVDNVLHKDIGGKGYNLYKLYQAGLPVPKAIVIRPQNLDIGVLKTRLEEVDWLSDGNTYAVRSSGVGEDSQDKSWAGIFDSYLFVEHNNVLDHVQKVMYSINSERYKKYSTESGVEISDMAVIVQEMVDADYAGVAFTTSPIENDPRIALLEVVKGVGESLVSNQKTPATLRVNKLTNMVRKQQSGDDDIEDSVLEEITDKLMPYFQLIEQLYGQPMDVEWAIRGGEVYILQARPITTI